MANIVRGEVNEAVSALKDALDAYEHEHPGAQASLYRQNIASIRIRVIDRRFEGMTKSRRHDDVWGFLAGRVAEDVLSEVSLLLPIPPAEQRSSLMNVEFEDPTASRL